MERQPTALWAQKEKEFFLNDVINDLVTQSSVYAARNGNIFSNNVQTDIRILTDTVKIRSILKRILELINTMTRKTHVHISAKTFTDLVLVHIKADGIQDVSLVFNELKQLVPDAELLSGFLGITTHEDKLITIAFTFLNVKNCPGSYTDRLVRTITQTSDYMQSHYR